jgi:SAM-dependent methyltransferase
LQRESQIGLGFWWLIVFVVERELMTLSGLKQFVAQTVASNHSLWAWENYKAVVLSLQREYACESLLEVGGGRTPLIDERENDSLGVKYTLNDISACELGSAPEWVSKACFDICSPPTDVHSKFDLIFSKMVFEHISDAKKAYMGIYRLLAPGGLFLSFFPTLYCLPFFINYLSPESLSSKLQRRLVPRDTPKFPAYYKWCRSSESLQRKLEGIGFSEVALAPFYGHGYYESIPLVRNLHGKWTEIIRRKDIRVQSSYAYAFVRR